MLFDGSRSAGAFNVIAQTEEGGVVGRLWCVRHSTVPELWYYGDLAVDRDYRRRGIASAMIKVAVDTISERGGHILRTYVEPENTASLTLQKVLGFTEKPYEVFDNLLNEGQLMLELDIPPILNARPATVEDAIFICQLYDENMEILHGGFIEFKALREMLADMECGEVNFLIHKGALPCAWLKLNGFGDGRAWISMLVVAKNMQRQGIGTFTVRFAEEYMRGMGIRRSCIHTTDDNFPAQSLYKRCGYTVTGQQGECTTGNGVSRKGLTFERDI